MGRIARVSSRTYRRMDLWRESLVKENDPQSYQTNTIHHKQTLPSQVQPVQAHISHLPKLNHHHHHLQKHIHHLPFLLLRHNNSVQKLQTSSLSNQFPQNMNNEDTTNTLYPELQNNPNNKNHKMEQPSQNSELSNTPTIIYTAPTPVHHSKTNTNKSNTSANSSSTPEEKSQQPKSIHEMEESMDLLENTPEAEPVSEADVAIELEEMSTNNHEQGRNRSAEFLNKICCGTPPQQTARQNLQQQQQQPPKLGSNKVSKNNRQIP